MEKATFEDKRKPGSQNNPLSVTQCGMASWSLTPCGFVIGGFVIQKDMAEGPVGARIIAGLLGAYCTFLSYSDL